MNLLDVSPAKGSLVVKQTAWRNAISAESSRSCACPTERSPVVASDVSCSLQDGAAATTREDIANLKLEI